MSSLEREIMQNLIAFRMIRNLPETSDIEIKDRRASQMAEHAIAVCSFLCQKIDKE